MDFTLLGERHKATHLAKLEQVMGKRSLLQIGVITSGELSQTLANTQPLVLRWNWKMMQHTSIWVEDGTFQLQRRLGNYWIIQEALGLHRME